MAENERMNITESTKGATYHQAERVVVSSSRSKSDQKYTEIFLSFDLVRYQLHVEQHLYFQPTTYTKFKIQEGRFVMSPDWNLMS